MPTATLWVNTFDSTAVAWTEVGSTPYLGAIGDGNHIYSAKANNAESYFGFSDSGFTSHVINGVSLEVYSGQASGGDDAVRIDMYNGGVYVAGTLTPANTGFTWQTLTLTSSFDTWAKIDGASIGFTQLKIGSGVSSGTIDAARLIIDYTESVPPTTCDVTRAFIYTDMSNIYSMPSLLWSALEYKAKEIVASWNINNLVDRVLVTLHNLTKNIVKLFNIGGTETDNFGYEGIGTNTDNMGGIGYFGSLFNLPVNATITKIYAYLDDETYEYHPSCRAYIWSNSGGTPTSLLASSGLIPINDSAISWKEFILTSPYEAIAGNYWLIVSFSDLIQFYFNPTGGTTVDGFDHPLSEPFDEEHTDEVYACSIYATYTKGGAGYLIKSAISSVLSSIYDIIGEAVPEIADAFLSIAYNINSLISKAYTFIHGLYSKVSVDLTSLHKSIAKISTYFTSKWRNVWSVIRRLNISGRRAISVLGEDSFRDGNIDGWSTSGTPTVSSNVAHHDSYSVYCNAASEYIYIVLAVQSVAYARAYIYFDTLPGTGEVAIVGMADATGTYYAIASIVNNVFQLRTAEGGSSTYNTTGITAQADTWYCVEVLRNNTNDYSELWINGVSSATRSYTIANDSSVFMSGSGANVGTPVVDLYVDCVVFSASYIGPEIAYLIKSNINKTISSLWNLISVGLINAYLTIKYTLQSRIAKLGTLLYNAKGNVYETLASIYGVKASIGSTLRAIYGNLGRVSESLSILYNIKSVRTKASTLQYNLQSRVSKLLIHTYAILSNVSKGLSVIWNLIGQYTVNASLILRYNLKEYVDTVFRSLYGIKSVRDRTATLAYNAKSNVSRAFSTLWSIISIGTVNAYLALKYNLLSRLPFIFTVKYDAKSSVLNAFRVVYGVRSSISRFLSGSYGFGLVVNKVLSIMYGGRAYVSKLLSLIHRMGMSFYVTSIVADPYVVIRTGAYETTITVNWYDVEDKAVEYYACDLYFKDTYGNTIGPYTTSNNKTGTSTYSGTYAFDLQPEHNITDYDIKAKVRKR